MTSATVKTLCFTCEKETRKFNCEGCLNNFCFNCLNKHVQRLNGELESIGNDYDQFREMLNYQKNDLYHHSLIEKINKWEKDSIEKIKQLANECREKSIKYLNKLLIKTENQLNELTKQIIIFHQENDFNEIDLNQMQEKLKKLHEKLNTTSDLITEQQSSSFINKIFLTVPINKDTRWKQHGITVAGGNGQGNQLNQLNNPQSLAVDDDGTIYIVDHQNDRVVEWKSNSTSGRIVAGGNGQGDQTNQLNGPINVLIDKETNSLIISDCGNSRVMEWSLRTNTNNGEILIAGIDCSCLTMDKVGDLYVSDWTNHEVRRFTIGEKNETVVAGGNGRGDKLNQLDHPTYLLVDENYSLYVIDRDNHRVMKWLKDAKEGIVVAGGSGQGISLSQLSCLQGLFMNQDGQMYVTDYNNHRVMRWCEGDKEGTIVVSGNGEGQEANQLNYPCGLSFDREGNLYVADYRNHRIQKFEID